MPAAPSTSATSAVSWSAIFAGATAAAAFSLILLMLGTGLGLSSLSPWTGRGPNPTTLGVSAIVWITVTQLMASGLGGYLAGRLRTKWEDAKTDEIFFRDTAHGFLAWSVSTLATAALFASVVGTLVNGGMAPGASTMATQASTSQAADAQQRASDAATRVQAQVQRAGAEAIAPTSKESRKATITATLWLFISLLVGAFTASLAATWGGRERDL